MKHSYKLIIILLTLVGCQEPVQLETPSIDDKILTVDGFITTEVKNHIISLKSSSKFNNNDVSVFDPLTTADVEIVDDNGQSFPLENLFNGDYRTSRDFGAEEGISYSLRIELDGNVYQSAFETVPAAASITDIYAQRESIQSLTDGNIVENEVVSYYIDYRAPGQNSFSIFDWVAIWEYYSPARANGTPVVCYPVDAARGLTGITNNIGLSTLDLNDVPVAQLNLNFKFDYLHNMEVILYTITEQAHTFHSKVLAQRDLSGSVFDASPIQIAGNVRSTSNPDLLVFGFFGAFNVSKRRIFTRGSDFDFVGIYPCLPLGCTDCRNIKPKTTGIKPDFWL